MNAGLLFFLNRRLIREKSVFYRILTSVFNSRNISCEIYYIVFSFIRRHEKEKYTHFPNLNRLFEQGNNFYSLPSISLLFIKSLILKHIL